LVHSQQKAIEASNEILPILFHEFSITKKFHQETLHYLTNIAANNTPDYSWLYGKWMQNEVDKMRILFFKIFQTRLKIQTKTKL